MIEAPSELRSRTMRAVKCRDTSPELKLRKALHGAGYRYRLHRKDLPGSPDMVFASQKVAIFVHGCFWHGHACKRGARVPKTNSDYWRKKIARNVARDTRVVVDLKAQGWRAEIVWECELNNLQAVLAHLTSVLRSAIELH